MGACGTSLTERFGADIGKIVVAEKSKQFIDLKAKETRDRIQQQADEMKRSTNVQVDNEYYNSQEKIRKVIAQIERQSPQALQKAALSQNKSKQQVLGSDEIKEKFQQFKKQASGKIDEQERNLRSTVEQTVKSQKQTIDTQKPRLPVFDSLPEEQKQKIIKDGEGEFSSQIKAQQDQLTGQLKGALDPEAYVSKLRVFQQSLNPRSLNQHVDSVLSNSKGLVAGTNVCC